MRRLIQDLDSSPTSHCHLYSTGIKILHRYWCAKSVISAVQIPRASREAQAAKEQRAHFCGRRRTTCTCANHGIVSSVVRTAINLLTGMTALDAMREYMRTPPGGVTLQINIDAYGGEIGKIQSNDTAFPHRNAMCSVQMISRLTQAADDKEAKDWL